MYFIGLGGRRLDQQGMTTSEYQRISVAIAMSVKATNDLVFAAELGHSVARKQLIGYAVESLQKALDEIEPMRDQLQDSPPSLDFRAMAVRVLRQHIRCGDQYPDDGWPEVNEALAQYALEQRQKNHQSYHGSGSGWCKCLLDTEEE